jgi:uroporphyrinogen-III synthase
MPRQSAIPVLVTRPEPQASRFAADLTARFGPVVRPVVSPLMEVAFLAPSLPEGPFDALILTSETGAEAAARLRDAGAALPRTALCVGDRTAEVAQGLGFEAQSAQGDVSALAALVLARPDTGPLLYLHAEDRAGDLTATLAAAGRQVWSRAVYAQRERPLSAIAETLFARKGRVLVPLFSPRTTRLFVAALPPKIRADLRCIAISAAAAHPLPAALAADAVIADRPDGPAMLAAISCVISSPSP